VSEPVQLITFITTTRVVADAVDTDVITRRLVLTLIHVYISAQYSRTSSSYASMHSGWLYSWLSPWSVSIVFTTGSASDQQSTNDRKVAGSRQRRRQNFRQKRSSTWYIYIAPQVDTATAEALRYMARAKQRRTYLPYTFPAIAGTHLPTPEDGGLSKPRPRVQRATGPRLLHDSPQPTDSNPRPRGRWWSALTTRPSRHRVMYAVHLCKTTLSQQWLMMTD